MNSPKERAVLFFVAVNTIRNSRKMLKKKAVVNSLKVIVTKVLTANSVMLFLLLLAREFGCSGQNLLALLFVDLTVFLLVWQ